MCLIVWLRQLQAAEFRRGDVLDLLDPDQLFFCLYEDQERETLSEQLILFRIVFTAIGVATFWPRVLEGYTDSCTKRYRCHGRLRKTSECLDGTLLYSMSEVSKHYAILASFSYCYLHMTENTSFLRAINHVHITVCI